MSASTQSTPAYKKRRIVAMLEQPVFPEMSHPVENSSLTWSPKFVSAVIGLACLCGVSVFLILYHHDASAASAAGRVAVTAAPGKGKASPAHGHDVTAKEHDVAAHRGVSVPEPVEFKVKRSAKYQAVGPLGLRLIRVNLKRRVCDVSIQLEGHRRLQRHLQFNRPFQFKPKPSGDAMEITISGVSRDSVAGSLTALSAPVAAEQ